MNKNTIIVIFMFLGFAGVVGFVGYSGLREPKVEPKKAVQGVSVPKTLAQQEKPNADQKTLPLESNQGSSLQVEGSNKKNDQNPLLDPSAFETYDSYKGSDQYLRQDIVVGTGAEVVEGKKVAVFYKGWLTNGEVFDQSRPNEAGELQPFVFAPGAGQVIQGWEIGILGMKTGGMRRLVLPPSAAYGETGQGSIPPDAVLIFDIELLEVEQ